MKPVSREKPAGESMERNTTVTLLLLCRSRRHHLKVSPQVGPSDCSGTLHSERTLAAPTQVPYQYSAWVHVIAVVWCRGRAVCARAHCWHGWAVAFFFFFLPFPVAFFCPEKFVWLSGACGEKAINVSPDSRPHSFFSFGCDKRRWAFNALGPRGTNAGRRYVFTFTRSKRRKRTKQKLKTRWGTEGFHLILLVFRPESWFCDANQRHSSGGGRGWGYSGRKILPFQQDDEGCQPSGANKVTLASFRHDWMLKEAR